MVEQYCIIDESVFDGQPNKKKKTFPSKTIKTYKLFGEGTLYSTTYSEDSMNRERAKVHNETKWCNNIWAWPGHRI